MVLWVSPSDKIEAYGSEALQPLLFDTFGKTVRKEALGLAKQFGRARRRDGKQEIRLDQLEREIRGQREKGKGKEREIEGTGSDKAGGELVGHLGGGGDTEDEDEEGIVDRHLIAVESGEEEEEEGEEDTERPKAGRQDDDAVMLMGWEETEIDHNDPGSSSTQPLRRSPSLLQAPSSFNTSSNSMSISQVDPTLLHGEPADMKVTLGDSSDSPPPATEQTPPTLVPATVSLDPSTLAASPAVIISYYRARLAALQPSTTKQVLRLWIHDVIDTTITSTKRRYKLGEAARPPWWPADVKHIDPDEMVKEGDCRLQVVSFTYMLLLCPV